MNTSNKIFKNEIMALFFGAASVFIMLALISFDIRVHSIRSQALSLIDTHNLVGAWGSSLSYYLFYYFGLTAFCLPVGFIGYAYAIYNNLN